MSHSSDNSPEPRRRSSSAETIVAGQTESQDSPVDFNQGSSSQATVPSVGPLPSSGVGNDSDPEDKALSISSDSLQHENSARQIHGAGQYERCHDPQAVADAIKDNIEAAVVAFQSAIANATKEQEHRVPTEPETDTRLAILKRWREVFKLIAVMKEEENSSQMPDFLKDFVEAAKAANESCSSQIEELSRSSSSSPDGFSAS